VGKTALVERLAEPLDATTCSRSGARTRSSRGFYDARRGALPDGVFFLLPRYRAAGAGQRQPLNQVTIADYVFERSKLFAYLNLEDSELLIYEKLYGLLAEGTPRPDLVVYLQAPTEVLLKRIARAGPEEAHLSEDYLAEVNRATTTTSSIHPTRSWW